MMKLITFDELCKLRLNPKTPVIVHYLFKIKYSYKSTYKWTSSIYKNFIKNNEIMFEVAEN